MAKNERYIKDLVLGLTAETVEPIIRKFLEDNQFYQSEWHGDVCWMTDLFNVKGYYFFAYSYDGTTLHLEAWLRNGKEGEMGLTGFAAVTSKAPYLQKINQLSQQLIQLLPADSPYRDRAQTEYKTEEKSLGKNKLVAYIVLICALCFLLLDLFINPSKHIISYIATFFAIMGVFGIFISLRK